jgi:hypothetical protein
MVDLGFASEVVNGGGVEKGKVEGVLSHCSCEGEEEGRTLQGLADTTSR